MTSTQPHEVAHPAEAHHDAHHTEDHSAHGATKLYWIIGIILAAVTLLEVFWPSLGFNVYAVLGGLFALMFLKGVMVVLFFMHLKGDPNIFKLIYIAPFTLAVSFVVAFIVLFTGTHPGIAG